MEPIISPWFFYFLGIVENLSYAFIFFAVTFGMLTVLFYTLFAMSLDKDLSFEGNFFIKTKIKYILPILFSIFLIITVIIPSKETMIQMIIAKNITPDNVKSIVNFSKSVKDEAKEDIVDIIKAVKDKK